MENNDIYIAWRDDLLSAVSEQICKPCTDIQKEQYAVNYDSPLKCGCRCCRVENILESVRQINEEIEKYARGFAE